MYMGDSHGDIVVIYEKIIHIYIYILLIMGIIMYIYIYIICSHDNSISPTSPFLSELPRRVAEACPRKSPHSRRSYGGPHHPHLGDLSRADDVAIYNYDVA